MSKDNQGDDFENVVEEELNGQELDEQELDEQELDEQELDEQELDEQELDEQELNEQELDEQELNEQELDEQELNEQELDEQELDEQELDEQEQEAQDSIIFSPSSKSKGKSKGNVAESIDASDAIDPITQAIRDEILYKQQLLLQQEIAKGLEGQEKEDFLDQDLTAIRAFLQTTEGKQAVDDVMKNPQLRKEMHEIERNGYKTVHSKFSENFRDVDWGKINEDKVRTTDIKDVDGNPVCTLKETTVDTKPQSIALADGTTQTINKYRQIDFPRELETGNGPMHASMAVRDANGNPISAKEAVYFTAHYDDNGKLTEVSSPTPVHFAGDGPDAIGYIEVDGKVFTLPVTKEKYQEMMQEVAKNNGLETDISQAVDQIQTKENLSPENEQQKQPKDIENVPEEQQENPIAIEDTPKEPKTEMQEIADKMRESREARGNLSAEPPEKPINEVPKSEMQQKAEEMRESREARGNPSAEPPEKSINEAPTEMQQKAEKMQQSREARGNPSAEPPEKPINEVPKSEMQQKADKMQQSREASGNPSAEPPVKANSDFGSTVKEIANKPLPSNVQSIQNNLTQKNGQNVSTGQGKSPTATPGLPKGKENAGQGR